MLINDVDQHGFDLLILSRTPKIIHRFFVNFELTESSPQMKFHQNTIDRIHRNLCSQSQDCSLP